jgi:hypothetical protein
MTEQLRQLVGCVSVVWVMLMSALPAGAEPSASATGPSAETATAVPTEEDVRRVIHQLSSVRDFERLRWILTAAEQQVPPVRGELLKQLDEQVQELVRNEVELRAATALASFQSIKPAQPERAEHTRAEQRREQAEAAQGKALLPEPTPDHPRSYVEVKDEITQAEFTTEPRTSMEQFRQLSQAIMAVPDAQQREELRTLLHERQMEAAKKHMEARQAEAESYFSSWSAAAQELPETNAQD